MSLSAPQTPAPVRSAPGGLPSLGLFERIALGALAAWLLTMLLAPESFLRPVALFTLLVSGFIVAVRWLRRGIQNAIWRLRDRLLLSYAFIAVVPVLLLFLLGWIGAWSLAGQTAVYLVTSQFQRNVELLHATSRSMVRADTSGTGEPATRLTVFLNSRFPGVQLLYTRPDQAPLRFPVDCRLEAPPAGTPSASGVLLKDGLLWAWAHHREGDRAVTVVAPVTKRALERLVPNLGDITLVDFTDISTSSGLRMRLHEPVEPESPAEAAALRGVPPAANSLDLPVLWGSPLPVHVWEQPGKERLAILGVHTRISQVFRVIFSRKADWDQPMLISLVYGIAGIFLVFELVALIIGISITRAMTGAVNSLYEGTQRVQAGDFSTRIPVKGDDQIAALSRSFNTMTENLERLLVVAKERERLEADLNIAREVQEQLYPRTVPPSPALAMTARLNPARSVSGDYFDYQRVDATHMAIAMGDVAGKGISAAILMANVQSALRSQMRYAYERTGCCSTSDIVSQLNKHLHAHTTPEKYATFYFGVYDESSGVLTSTNAGHLPPLLFRGDEVIQLEVNGMVVGAFPLARYDESKVQLEKDDLLVLYTDGITEPENAYGEMFGEERLIETIRRFQHESNERIIAEVFHAVEQWIHQPETGDDMTMLLVRRVA